MRTITDRQRRARLAARHGLAFRVGTVAQAAEAVCCLHSTEPATVYLSVAARAGVSRADVSRALYDERSVVKQLAMRRTLFAFPRDLLPAVWGSASQRVSGQLRARLAKEVEANGLATQGQVWVDRTCAAILRTLEEEGPATTAELRERVPELSARLDLAPGKTYAANVPVASRLLGALGAGGQVLRGVNEGDWRTSRPRWTKTAEWLPSPPEPTDPAAGYRELVRCWLDRFGPGTEEDLVWWLGATKGAVRRALAELDVVEVGLEDGAAGFLLPDDLEDVVEPEPWAALLPVLDPTTMGWKRREFYLGPHSGSIFDTNGNAGTTAWWCGRVVGCWVQDAGGEVRVVTCTEPGEEAREALRAEADRLTAWLDGDVVSPVYVSPLMRRARAETAGEAG